MLKGGSWMPCLSFSDTLSFPKKVMEDGPEHVKSVSPAVTTPMSQISGRAAMGRGVGAPEDFILGEEAGKGGGCRTGPGWPS